MDPAKYLDKLSELSYNLYVGLYLVRKADILKGEILWDDINGDNSVNISDVTALLGKIVGGGTDPAYDVNGDGVVNIADVIQLLKVVVGG